MTIINRYPRHSKLANIEAIFLKHLQQIGHICHNVIIEFIKNELMDDLRPAWNILLNKITLYRTCSEK